MEPWAKQIGLTIRTALRSWPETFRLCVLIGITAATTTIVHYLLLR